MSGTDVGCVGILVGFALIATLVGGDLDTMSTPRLIVVGILAALLLGMIWSFVWRRSGRLTWTRYFDRWVCKREGCDTVIDHVDRAVLLARARRHMTRAHGEGRR